jgi:hypothetical protein
LTNTIGIGPVADFSVGRYTQVTTDTGRLKIEGDIADDERATHFWLMLGGRMVVFP